MVFVNKEWEESDGIVVYSNYHRYWQNREMRIKILILMYLVVKSSI